jgi:hypothetical protein
VLTISAFALLVLLACYYTARRYGLGPMGLTIGILAAFAVGVVSQVALGVREALEGVAPLLNAVGSGGVG